MADRIITQVHFQKFLWTCPKCGQEDVVDASMIGGNEYIHDCSACSAHFNQSGPNMKEYNGSLSMLTSEYKAKKEKDITDEKTKKFDDWLYKVKNPPPYVEPTLEEYEKMKAEAEERVAEYEAEIIKLKG